MIQTGKSSSASILGDAVMGSDTVIKHLREAEKDKTVKAIVLRVDSGGGSALASDLIWREVTRIEKPIVASMSDVAASGGYYISMGADKIYAEPGTITGSIGVTGGKFVLGGLMEKLGVTTDTVTVGKNGTISSRRSSPSPTTEKAAMQKLMDETYKQFVGKAAAGPQDGAVDELEKLAGGRVYTGRQAKELGLVDELGTLDDAIDSARTLAGDRLAGDRAEDPARSPQLPRIHHRAHSEAVEMHRRMIASGRGHASGSPAYAARQARRRAPVVRERARRGDHAVRIEHPLRPSP